MSPRELRELSHSHGDTSTNLNRVNEEVVRVGSGVTVSRFSISFENKREISKEV